MKNKVLSNGLKMPELGYGVFQIDEANTEILVGQALQAGYRMIDTAQAYGNEGGVGAAIKNSGLSREEIFLVTKVWVSNYGEGKTYESIKKSLDLLGTDYIDLLLLHQPYNDYYGAWRDLERAYEEGLVKAIGVSNFDPIRLIDLVTFARIKPMVNQIETHVFRPQLEAHQGMEATGVQHMAWGPFAEGMNGIFTNETLARVAQRHNKSVGQVALRYLLDMDVIVIPKSSRPERMEENMDVFDFELTDQDRAEIAQLANPGFTCFDHSSLENIGGLLGFIKSSM